MKLLYIICEGQTERDFCNELLYEYFLDKDIVLQAILIKKSNGGIVPWHSLKKQIEICLKSKEAWATTFIDYYGIPDQYNFPAWEEAKKIKDLYERMAFLQEQMKQDVADTTRWRFIPYLQLHEFEALLFHTIDVFDDNFKPEEFRSRDELVAIFSRFSNPEYINGGKDTAPSKRLEKIIKGYKKPLYGVDLASEIGLDNIRKNCKGFDSWIKQLVTL